MEPKKNKSDPLSESFDIEPIHSPSTELANITASSEDDAIVSKYDSDYEFSRENIKQSLVKAEELFDEIAELARQSQLPRAYEVAGGVLKTIFDGNKDLMELAKRHKDLKGGKVENTNNTTNNNLFIGSTHDLHVFLEKNGINSGLRTIEATPKE